MRKNRLSTTFIFLVFAFIAAPSLRSETPEISSNTPLALSNLAVPEELGKVQERFSGNPSPGTGSNSRTIIQIQDVHAHVTAQQNIAAILDRLHAVFGVQKAALEGAWVSTSLPRSQAIPTSREKQLLAATLLDDDRISGPVYAAIMSPEPITLVGIEDEHLYENNRALFLTHLERSREIDEALRTYGASLQESQRSGWGPGLLTFGNAFGKFRDTSDLGKFFPVLWETAAAQNADASDLPQILLVRDILSLEKLLQKERLEQEIQHLMREYKNTAWTLEELIRGGKIPVEKLAFYPELKKMTRLYQLRDQVSLGDLTAQIETLTGRILEKLVLTPEEKALWEKSERFYLARRILLLQASPRDIKTYETEKQFLEPELAQAGLAEALVLSLDFYDRVKKRDEIFFEKIMSDPSLQGNIAIVTGGFHTDGLSQRFRDAGVPYITITPELGDAPANEKLYEARMKEEEYPSAGGEKQKAGGLPSSEIPHPASSTLSELRNAIRWIDDRFPESYEVLLQTRDVREAKKLFLGNSASAPGPAKPSGPMKEKRATAGQPGATARIPELRVNEFMAAPRPEQLKTVRGWLTRGQERHEKAMLVSSVSILTRVLLEKNAEKLLEQAVTGGDVVALAQDVPVKEMPAALSSMRGIDRFEAADIGALIERTPRFQRLAKKRPFAIMENGHPGGAYVVLPEKPVSLMLFRIVTLNPNLYQAAKDAAFLALLQDLVSEILSQESSGKSV